MPHKEVKRDEFARASKQSLIYIPPANQITHHITHPIYRRCLRFTFEKNQ